MTTEEGRAQLRWMVRGDLPDVVAIERDSFAEPWDVEDFSCLVNCGKYVGLVCETGDPQRGYKILGYVIYRLGRKTVQLVNLAVHPTYRRNGVGSVLTDRLKRCLRTQPNRIEVVVPDDMLDAHLFFRSQGFRAMKVERGFFDGQDGYVMEHRAVNLAKDKAFAKVEDL